MSPGPIVAAVVGLLLMLAVGGAYFAVSRRHPQLAHPIAIVAFVTIVGVVVAVLGEVYRSGWTGVPTMARRAAIGGAGWGVIIAAGAWIVRRGLTKFTR